MQRWSLIRNLEHLFERLITRQKYVFYILFPVLSSRLYLCLISLADVAVLINGLRYTHAYFNLLSILLCLVLYRQKNLDGRSY